MPFLPMPFAPTIAAQPVASQSGGYGFPVARPPVTVVAPAQGVQAIQTAADFIAPRPPISLGLPNGMNLVPIVPHPIPPGPGIPITSLGPPSTAPCAGACMTGYINGPAGCCSVYVGTGGAGPGGPGYLGPPVPPPAPFTGNQVATDIVQGAAYAAAGIPWWGWGIGGLAVLGVLYSVAKR